MERQYKATVAVPGVEHSTMVQGVGSRKGSWGYSLRNMCWEGGTTSFLSKQKFWVVHQAPPVSQGHTTETSSEAETVRPLGPRAL